MPRFAARAWSDLGGDPAALERVERVRPGARLPSALEVADLVTDGVALAVLAVHELLAARDGTEAAPVRVRGDVVTTSVQSDRHLSVEGHTWPAWAPLSGFWRSADGWVRTHGNYPHHEQRLRTLVGVDASATPETFAAAVAERDALDLEDAAADAGAIVGAVRDTAAWRAHPHARTLAASPLLGVRHVPGAAPRAMGPPDGAPLAGVRVLDLTRVIAGPVATRDLAHAGADVLRVDPPHLPELPRQHLDTGQGKRSSTLDLRTAAGRCTLEGLLAAADVVVTGYRPGSLDAFGLAPDVLLHRFPGLVVGTVSAWGATGAWAGRRGFDSVVQAVTGIAVAESADGTTPGAMPAQVLDHAAGHLLAAAVVRGLLRQRTEGGGWHVSVALARVAQELLDSSRRPETGGARSGGEPAPPTVVTADTPAGRVMCAAPVLAYRGAPDGYAWVGRPWGSDRPEWLPVGR